VRLERDILEVGVKWWSGRLRRFAPGGPLGQLRWPAGTQQCVSHTRNDVWLELAEGSGVARNDRG